MFNNKKKKKFKRIYYILNWNINDILSTHNNYFYFLNIWIKNKPTSKKLISFCFLVRKYFPTCKL